MLKRLCIFLVAFLVCCQPGMCGYNPDNGTVTNVTSSNASPLFNVNVSTSNTVPAFAFTQQNAAANTVFCNPTGSSAAPVFGVAPIAGGGTGQTSAGAAFNALAPSTLLGGLIYGSGTNQYSNLAGNTSSTRKFLVSLGSSGLATAPFLDVLASGDIPAVNLATSGNGGVTGTLPPGNGGTGVVTTPTDGAVFIGNSLTSGYVLTQLIAGSGINITNGHGSITIANVAALSNPMNAIGQMIYGGSGGTPNVVAANTTTTKQFLTETGTGSNGNAPVFGTIALGDIPATVWSTPNALGSTTPSSGAFTTITTTGNITPSTAGGATAGSSTVPYSAVYLGTSANTNKILSASLSSNYVCTLPAANSNPIQPLSSATTGQAVTYIDAAGVQHLGAAGGFVGNYSAQTTSFTAVVGQLYYCNGTMTITLPTAVGNGGGQILVFNVGTGTLTFASTSGQTIGTFASGGLTGSVQGNSFSFYSDNANWQVQ